MSHHLPSPAPSPFPGGHNGAIPPTDPAAVRAELETQLKRLSQDLLEAEICAGEVQAGKEEAVPGAKINAALVELAKLAPQVTDSVPKSIVDHVDRYKNPHLYTKTSLSRATGENQYALGRILGLESFRSQLAEQLSEAFPEVPLPERRHKPVGVDMDLGRDGEDAMDGHGDIPGESGSGAVAPGANGEVDSLVASGGTPTATDVGGGSAGGAEASNNGLGAQTSEVKAEGAGESAPAASWGEPAGM